MRHKIAILFHKVDRLQPLNYQINHFARIWHNDGNDVFFLFGIDQFIPADLIIVHVDLSVVPEEYLRFAKRYPVALNTEVKDIRKTTFSRLLVKPGDAYEGKVIVKSNFNYAGQPERARGLYPYPEDRHPSATPAEGQDAPPIFHSPGDYRIYDSAQTVPASWYDDPAIVVEKFLPEIENGLYHTRGLHFLGDRMTCVRLSSPNPIVAGSTLTSTEQIEPDPEIVKLREAMKFDFGKFDYVVHDGEAVLLDVNKTVGAGTIQITPAVLEGFRYRAKGIYSYFSDSMQGD